MSLATATFTAEEENLIQLLPPTNPIDSTWINEADTLISGDFFFFWLNVIFVILLKLI